MKKEKKGHLNNGKKTCNQLNKSAILEAAVQVSSVGITIYLVDFRSFPFLGNSSCANANLFYSKIPNQQVLDI